ncbi:hypothetical protein L1987_72382 [Smallanthus sonchifolius]|uniref:Uncharacterized protein n=1 Tax=Smallanthus sonchifolius TaxID=185202 RepID=A0ACB9AV21_9ASTR|nr:hypothetical protein L1987_72382 [Smallanthus sonchifolius]
MSVPRYINRLQDMAGFASINRIFSTSPFSSFHRWIFLPGHDQTEQYGVHKRRDAAVVAGRPWSFGLWRRFDSPVRVASASTKTQKSKKEGFLLVSFFGDVTYKWLDPEKLTPFESNYNLYCNGSRSRLFVKAVNEAVYEVSYRAALGLTCPCSYFTHYRRAPLKDLLEDDIDGYKLGEAFAVKKIERFRQDFKPAETHSFIQQLALDSTDVHQDLNHSKEVARVLSFRKSRYAEIDEPYFHAFGVDPSWLGDPVVATNKPKTYSVQAPTDRSSEAESQGQKQPKVKHQNKKSPAQKDKQHASKTERSKKKDEHHNSSTKNSKDRAPKKQKRCRNEAEEKRGFCSSTIVVKEQPSLSCSNHNDSDQHQNR